MSLQVNANHKYKKQGEESARSIKGSIAPKPLRTLKKTVIT
jgi:hypothetical protein